MDSPLGHCDHRKAQGFTYVGLLIFIAILSVSITYALEAGSALQLRAKEQELIFVGLQYQHAFDSYADATPMGQPVLPKNLEELLLDTRSTVTRRHLRKVFLDPITAQNFAQVRDQDGRLLGVRSRATDKPIKAVGFPADAVGMEAKEHYSDWVFGNTRNRFAPRH